MGDCSVYFGFAPNNKTVYHNPPVNQFGPLEVSCLTWVQRNPEKKWLKYFPLEVSCLTWVQRWATFHYQAGRPLEVSYLATLIDGYFYHFFKRKFVFE